MSEILRVNPIACTGHGVCAELLPEFIRLDPWGFPIVPALADYSSVGLPLGLPLGPPDGLPLGPVLG